MNSLEEELKQLKSSTFSKVNNNQFHGFELSKKNIEANNNNKGLVIRSISKTYDNRKIVNQVSLELQKGEAVGLLGPNGAGKTTCFYMIAGLIDTDEGDIILDHSRINHLPMHIRARNGIGYLPQESSIFRGLTVEQNILSVLEIQKFTKNQKFQILEELMSEFDIGKIRN